MLTQTRSTLQALYAELLTSAILFAGVTWLFHTPHATHLPIENAAALGLLAVFTYNGWQFLTRQFPGWWIGSGIIWLICSTAKLVASFFIGVVVGPLRIMKSLVQLYSLQRLRRQLAMNRALSKSDRADEESSPNRARLI